MEDHLFATMIVATVALCAIVGIYYIWVRKSKSASRQVCEHAHAGVPQK